MNDSVEIVAAALREFALRIPDTAVASPFERHGSDIEQSDDYPIDWEFVLDPAASGPCPVTVFASHDTDQKCHWGFLFDTRENLSKTVGLRPRPSLGHAAAFGTEPREFSAAEVVRIVQAALHGAVVVQYRSVLGWLTSTAGLIELDDGPVHFQGLGPRFGTRATHRYQPWPQAA